LRDGFSFSITGPIAYADFERERLEKLRLEEMRARKTREEYQADLLEGLRRRESRHSALYLNTRRRCIGLPCLELLWSVRQRLALEAGLASKKRTPI
jgi:hypothetical protein